MNSNILPSSFPLYSTQSQYQRRASLPALISQYIARIRAVSSKNAASMVQKACLAMSLFLSTLLLGGRRVMAAAAANPVLKNVKVRTHSIVMQFTIRRVPHRSHHLLHILFFMQYHVLLWTTFIGRTCSYRHLAQLFPNYSRLWLHIIAFSIYQGWDLFGRVPHDEWLFTTRALTEKNLLKRSFLESVNEKAWNYLLLSLTLHHHCASLRSICHCKNQQEC